jgi:acyl transferase domain-containing protein/acyl carrier protein
MSDEVGRPDEGSSLAPSLLAQIQQVVREELATRAGLAPHAINSNESFSRYGLDSAGVVSLSAKLSDLVGRSVPPTLLFRCPTLNMLLGRLAGRDAARAAEPADRQSAREPLAIVGMACRLPGASDIGAFWQLLENGVDAVGQVPKERWDGAGLASPDLSAPGRAVTNQAGFISDVDKFDALFFGISPREAEQMDPQQRLMLELAWEALEAGGIAPRSLANEAVGVFVGAIWQDYAQLGVPDLTGVTTHTATGQALNMIANRVSYVLGLRGPSLVVDTACSSSLVAVHLACQSLWSGECNVALAGGVSLMLSPHTMVALSKFGGLSADGRCKAFDASADGFGRGEGGGVIVLKPLSAALAAGDPICAVIRGTAMNNDGPSNGLTAPNPQAQEAVLRAAYARAGVGMEQVGYLEAHGTGTALGDPIEASAIGAVIGKREQGPLRVGSVKTNLGHLEGAAGIAGLLKAVLCVQKRTIVPSLHFKRPNPHIDFEALGLRVADRKEDWPIPDGAALAGVSSFGWGGTNAHVVVEEYPQSSVALLTLAAEDQDELRAQVEQLEQAARSARSLRELHTSAGALGRGRARAAITARSLTDVSERCEAFLRRQALVGLVTAEARAQPVVAFVCSPQGGQWVGMGRLLLQTAPAFRTAFERVDTAFREHAGWSLVQELFRDEASARYDDVSVVQPLLFAVQIALAEQWKAWGAAPGLVIGHSLGEITAAHLAGILDLHDACLVVYHYSRLQRRLAERGGMMAVELATQPLAAILEGLASPVVVAACNGPHSTVVSGDPQALDDLLAVLKARAIKCARIRVNVAAHGPQIDEIAAELEAALQPIVPRVAVLPMVSTVTGLRVHGPELDARYFARNLREPVLLAQVLDRALRAGLDACIELSPHPVLGAALRQCVEHAHSRAHVLASSSRGVDERVALYDARGELFCLGGLPEHPPCRAELVLFSAHNDEALKATLEAQCNALRTSEPPSITDLAFTTQLRRSHHAKRACVVAATPLQVQEALAGAATDPGCELITHEQSVSRAPSVVFVFPGQGSQWHGMACQLLREEAVFRAKVVECDAVIARLTGWSVMEELTAAEPSSRISDVGVVQPVLFTISVALAAQWKHWGVTPSAVIGHSMGEVAAAHVAGALDLDDAARIICRRSELLRRVSGQGAMLATELTREDAQTVIEGREHLISIAVSSSTRSTVLSGDRTALTEVEQALEQEGVFCRWVKVDVASHSPQMDPLRADLLAVLDGIVPHGGEVPIFSTVLSRTIDGAEMRPEYWVSNLREPVWFADAVRAAAAAGHDVFLELSPHPILLPAMEQELAEVDADALVLGSLRRHDPERESLLRSLGLLFARGMSLELRNLAPCSGKPCSLPSYAWQKERFWRNSVDVPPPKAEIEDAWLGRHVASASQPGTHYFAAEWGNDMKQLIQGHVVDGETVAPGALLLQLAQEALEKATGRAAWKFGPVHFERPLVLAAQGLTSAQIVVLAGESSAEIKLFTASSDAFILHAQLWARTAAPPSATSMRSRRSPPAITEKVRRYRREEYYALLSQLGLAYDAAYRSVESVAVDEAGATARISVHDVATDRLAAVAGIDAALQALVAVIPAEARAERCALVSTGMDGFEQLHPLPREFVSRATLRQDSGREFTADVEAWSDAGQLLLRAIGVRVLTRSTELRSAPAEQKGIESAPNLHAELARLDSSRQRERVLQALREIVGGVVKLSASRVPSDVPLRSLGMDSIMALELRNRIELRIGARISATALYNHPTLDALSRFVAAQLLQGASAPIAVATSQVEASQAVGQGSDVPIEQLLAAELQHVQRLMENVG